MAKYYENNEIDITTKETLGNEILVKVVKQVIDSQVFDGVFGVFTRNELDGVGFQWEEIEVGNLHSEDFDPQGTDALKKVDMNFKSLYHKKNRQRTFTATVSNAQVKNAMLSEANMAQLATAITNELSNSSAIEDYEAVKDLLVDIAGEQKKMVICDMNGNAGNVDNLIKTIQTLATNMTLPSTYYNYSGFKKAFNKKSDLVLIIDSATEARLNVDSLAGAFNMNKKDLVANMIVIDEMPNIEYAGLMATKGKEIDIGTENLVTTYKADESGSETISGKALAFLVDKRAVIREPVEREVEDMRNGKGRFTNYFLHASDILSYSTLKNAIVIVD